MDYEALNARARAEWDADPRLAYGWPDYLTFLQARMIEGYRFDAIGDISERFSQDREKKTQDAIARLQRVRDPATCEAAHTFAERHGHRLAIYGFGPFVEFGNRPGQFSAEAFVNELAHHKDARVIYLRLSSTGGSVTALETAQAGLKAHGARSVAVIDHFAGSAAADLAISCDRTIIRANAMIMFHRASKSVAGNCEELHEYARQLNRIDGVHLKRLLKKAPAHARRAVELAYLNSRYLSAQEALEYRIVDAIAPALLDGKAIATVINSTEERKP